MTTDTRPAREWPIPWMDKLPGGKDTAFDWDMGALILARIAEGDTMMAITAHPKMPAYCTVYRWMQVVPEFGQAVAELRAQLAAQRLAERDALRRLESPRRRRGGRRSTLTGARMDGLLDGIRAGASLSELVAVPGAPSFRVIYRAVRRCPGFRAVFAEACDYRALALALEGDMLVDELAAQLGSGRVSLAEANAAIRRIDGRRGRLTPKLYRTSQSARWSR